jgi:hypothetical protein
MEHSDFRIGLEFWSGDKQWRCTDIGTRVVTAIALGPREVVSTSTSVDEMGRSTIERRHYMTDDPWWLNGPPYAVAESVFDEYDIEGCALTQEDA